MREILKKEIYFSTQTCFASQYSNVEMIKKNWTRFEFDIYLPTKRGVDLCGFYNQKKEQHRKWLNRNSKTRTSEPFLFWWKYSPFFPCGWICGPGTCQGQGDPHKEHEPAFHFDSTVVILRKQSCCLAPKHRQKCWRAGDGVREALFYQNKRLERQGKTKQRGERTKDVSKYGSACTKKPQTRKILTHLKHGKRTNGVIMMLQSANSRFLQPFRSFWVAKNKIKQEVPIHKISCVLINKRLATKKAALFT